MTIDDVNDNDWWCKSMGVRNLFLVVCTEINVQDVNNKRTRARYEVCSKLTIKIPKRICWWKYFTPRSSVSTTDFGQVNVHYQIVSLESLTNSQAESHLRLCKGYAKVTFLSKNIPQMVLLILLKSHLIANDFVVMKKLLLVGA